MTIRLRSGGARAVASFALLVAGAGVGLAAPASAETSPLAVTVTASPTTGLVDGSDITVNIDAKSPPNATASQIFGADARICKASAVIDFSADFNPTQLGNCALHPLSAGTDALKSVVTAPPNLTASLTFKVGIGSDTFESLSGSTTIQCGPGNPCKLVVKLQVPGATQFTSFPLNYAGDVSGDRFHALTPTRILDSRPPPESVGGFTTPWTAGLTRDVVVADGVKVPANADAVVINATVTATTASSYLAIWPKDAPKPTASSLNWGAGQTIPNAVTVKVGTGGKVSVYNNSGSANVIFDVVGYYDTAAGGAGFTSLTPKRILDSRPPPESVGGFTTPWTNNLTRDVTVADGTTVPLDADAVVLNATVTGGDASSYLTVWPKGAAQPTASSLNWVAGQTIPNAVTVKVGTGGKVSVYNKAGNVNVIFDVVGYFKVGTGEAFHPLTPARFLDSRPPPESVGGYTTPWSAGNANVRDVTVTGGTVPSTATAVLTNFTVTTTSANSYLTVWPKDAPKPTASSLNWGPGTTIANAVAAKVGTGGKVSVYNNTGTVNVIADVSGYYGP